MFYWPLYFSYSAPIYLISVLAFVEIFTLYFMCIPLYKPLPVESGAFIIRWYMHAHFLVSVPLTSSLPGMMALHQIKKIILILLN